MGAAAPRIFRPIGQVRSYRPNVICVNVATPGGRTSKPKMVFMALDPSPQRDLRGTLSGMEYLQRMIDGEISESPFNEHLGIRVTHAEPGTVMLECTVRPEHLNKIGSGHGGFVSSLLDNACGLAVDTLTDAGKVWTTMDLHVRFLKAVTLEAGTLRIVGHADHVGGHTSVSHAEVIRADGAVLASATSSLYALDVARLAAVSAAAPSVAEAGDAA